MTPHTAVPDAALIRLLQEAQAAIDPFVSRLLHHGSPYTDGETAFLFWHARLKILLEPYTGEMPLPDMSEAPPLSPQDLAAATDFGTLDGDDDLPAFPAWKSQRARAGAQWAGL